MGEPLNIKKLLIHPCHVDILCSAEETVIAKYSMLLDVLLLNHLGHYCKERADIRPLRHPCV